MSKVTNFAKYGYFNGLEKCSPAMAMLIFCGRRADAVIKDFGTQLKHNDLMARIYYQGLKDGMDAVAEKPESNT